MTNWVGASKVDGLKPVRIVVVVDTVEVLLLSRTYRTGRF